ncbi:MAG: N-acetylglucosamine kinase, partial [Cyclobacteriaceae bacterium]
MILVADSGGSKIDWRILSGNGKIEQASGPGFNPYYQPPTDLEKSIEENLLPAVSEEVNKVFFYGAGVSSPANQDTIKKVLKGFFKQA